MANEDTMSQAEMIRTLKDIQSRVQSVESRVQSVESRVQSVDSRVQSVEQILPTLATKEDVKTAIREEGQRVDAKIKEEGERTRLHMNIIAERVHDDVRLIAEAQVGADERFERHRAEHRALARRVTRLEDVVSARKPRK